MPTKRSPHSHTIEFFSDAPLDQAEMIYSMVRDIMTKRRKAASETPQPRKVRHVRTKKNKVASSAPVAVESSPSNQVPF